LKELFEPASESSNSAFDAEWQATFHTPQEAPKEDSLLSGLNFDSFLPSKMLDSWPKSGGTLEEMMPLCPEQSATESKKVKKRFTIAFKTTMIFFRAQLHFPKRAKRPVTCQPG
jgi:hypothetical protein